MSVAALHWGWPVAGGLMIGSAAALYLVVAGRVMGVSGMLAGATGLGPGGARVASALFMAGLLVGTLAAMAISFGLLAQAMKALPLGTAYAVWVGIGAVGTALVGITLLGEPANPGRLISIALIVAGVIGLKLATA